MGNTSSSPVEEKDITHFNTKYNWVPSFPMREYTTISEQNITKCVVNPYVDTKKYVDLRNNFPPVLDIGNIPVHTIASVCSVIHYQLIKNKLPIFPPSRLFIYKNLGYYPDVHSIIPYESVFKSIEKYGICSEVDFPYIIENLNITPSSKNYKIAEAFKFIDVYKITNKLEIIKTFLQDGKPLLIGMVLYYDLNNITDRLWLPDLTIDKRIGGISGIIIGYVDDRQQFIVKLELGDYMGLSGYVSVPYEYIVNTDLVPEIYYIDLCKMRVEGYMSQYKELISLQQNSVNKKINQPVTDLNNLFN